MSKYTGLGIGLAIGALLFSTSAFAGAWTLDAGTGQALVTETASQASRGTDGNRDLRSVPLYTKNEVQALIEYGVTKDLTAIITPSLQRVDVGEPYNALRGGLGYTDVGARVRITGGDNWVFSGQTLFRVPGTFDKTNIAAIGYTDPEVDVRGLFGYSFKAGDLPSFVDVQVAQRFRLGGPPDELRIDVTLGIRPTDRLLLLAQSFNVMSEGAGTWGYSSYDYYKLQLSAVYGVTPELSLQLGGFTTYAGRNGLQENGLVVAAWYKF
jgi:hypothetical protein